MNRSAATGEVRALLRVLDHPGVFEAEVVELADGLIHATGCWVRRGVVPPEAAREPRRSYTWPRNQLREIRWLAGGEPE